ncbi:phage recombination protein Bet [Geomonas propionica]|uniref:Phage recombination protein Bet n=1 Tax=Geomonas propionica TaxID=2798582 RepID=A0ABS0YPA3_9BACT|nr:phage recombination protein Bet [Geomonas propionica]MBJ6799749.1 phage recombination protein Bet [Geomonas propionica]
MSNNAVTKIDFDKDQLAVIEAQFFPAGASKAEQQYCFAVARELGLNPILKEVQFVPRRQKVGDRWVNKVEPMVGRDGFLSIAHKSNQIAGIETTACIKEVPQLEHGSWVVKPQLVAECTVWRKDSSKPFTAQVAYNEYVQKTSDGTPTKFWAEKPETMLKKVAESQALRKAFNIHGVYCPEEVGAGYETASGEILAQEVEAEFVRVEPDRNHLCLVPSTAQPEAETDAQNGAESYAPDDVINRVTGLLEEKGIPYEVDRERGIVSAKSYNERQLLKDSGFRWNGDSKSWIYLFDPTPF